jgi:hypothetical protein
VDNRGQFLIQQDDRIGRFFALGANVHFGLFIFVERSSTIERYQDFTKNGNVHFGLFILCLLCK